MPADYLHNHPQFADLIRIVASQRGIDPFLVEKDYWIMHCLYGLQQLGMTFELKGGTSLSKGFQIINRFSEDIDIRIEPPPDQDVKTGRNQTSPAQVKTRKDFYDWLAKTIKINGIEKVERDTAFDNKDYFSGGIRLFYKSINKLVDGLREGVLLEAGFDDVTPNSPKDISSWVYDHAAGRKAEIIDNRAKAVPCYDPGYTLVEKLQTISTKFRLQQANKDRPIDFMRHYYDVYGLLQRPEVQAFIGSDAYKAHKAKRFPRADNQDIAQNDAFILSDPTTRSAYARAYTSTAALYYAAAPTFTEILDGISARRDEL
jgi:Nucleotidyl transferase AbiEii toxin, Type IV TA system